MGHSVIEMTRAVRRRLERVVRKSREKDYARRALAVLHLWETQGDVADVAHRVRAARSSRVIPSDPTKSHQISRDPRISCPIPRVPGRARHSAFYIWF